MLELGPPFLPEGGFFYVRAGGEGKGGYAPRSAIFAPLEHPSAPSAERQRGSWGNPPKILDGAGPSGTLCSERAFDPPWYLRTEGRGARRAILGRAVESRAEKYRRLARECMTLASTSVSEPGRYTLI
jgi:hypothetical protein